MNLNFNSDKFGIDYEVFLNFRGSDTRQGLADVLLHKLAAAGVRVFFDEKSIRPAEEIARELDQAIKHCQMYIAIFSEGYASSKWCLRELTLMNRMRKSEGKHILPIFYKVTVEDVKLQTDLYNSELRKHRKNGEYQEVGEWENALREVAKIKGLMLHKAGYTDFSERVVEDVLSLLKTESGRHCLVGMEDHLKAIKEKLDIESGDVRFLVIHGKSGIGKTTLAKVVFKQLSARFQGSSFLEDIRESSKVNGFKFLENQLLSDIPDNENDFRSITERFRDKKVLIVLDDVDKREQIENLASNYIWFGPGSRIILTTTNRNVLAIEQNRLHEGIIRHPQEVLTYEMREMNLDQALQLFCRHAFRGDSPPKKYCNLSGEVVRYTGRLPLTIEIIGSFLHRKEIRFWTQTIDRLSEIGPHAVQQKLKIIYEALASEAKQIFLDIACFFVNKEKTNPIYMWKSCYWNTEIEDLSMMSLVKIVDNKLWMHDQVREFGRNIVLKESLEDPGERSRVWKHKEAFEVLKKREGKQKVEALRLCYDDSLQQYTFTDREFSSMKRLRFLELYLANVDGEWDHLLCLRWLSWHYCPCSLKTKSLCSLNLVILDLSKSSIGNQWNGWSQLQAITSLKVLDLTGCEELTKTPDFSKYKSLERLILEGCKNLVELDSSIGALTSLKYLNVRGCDSLISLPEELGSLGALEEILIMKGSGGSSKVPHSLGILDSLSTLEVANVEVIQFPQSIGLLGRLTRLSLFKCSGIKQLPDGMESLKSLIELDISETNITEFPDSIRELKELKVIKMENSSIRELSCAIGLMEKLEELHAKQSKNLRGNMPESIGLLAYLRILDLSYTGISGLPQSMSRLSRLQTLNLESCNELQEVTELPENLTRLHLTCWLLQRIRNLSKLNNLVDLVIFDAMNEPPNELEISILLWAGNLPNLKNLELGIPDLSTAPLTLCLSELKVLKLSCPQLESFSDFPGNLSRLFLGHVKVHKMLSHFSSLRRLTFLNLYKCSIGPGSLELAHLVSLVHFSAHRCHFSILDGLHPPKDLRTLCLIECEFHSTSLNLSGLKDLKQLEMSDCKEVDEIHGLGELESLQELTICGCNSLQSLDISNLRKLEYLELQNCDMLRSLKGYEGIKTLRKKMICCRNLDLRKPARQLRSAVGSRLK